MLMADELRVGRHAARRRPRRRWALFAAILAILATGLVGLAIVHGQGRGELTFERLSDPARTAVRDPSGTIVAMFTDGARTVALSGAERILAEPAATPSTVVTHAVIRLAPQPWRAGEETAAWFRGWFDAARSTAEPDVLAIAMQYVHGAPDQHDTNGVRIAGEARFGPAREGQVSEFSDFTDYLGIDWRYPDGTVRAPVRDRYGTLDCSGFVRIVYGYRSGYPMEFLTPTDAALPRRAVLMAGHSPGALVVDDAPTRDRELDRLQPGDLVFFDVDPVDGPQVDHVGIYLGIDSTGRRRFISSRKTNDGPTMGDLGGVSVLDGTGLYAKGFRLARRI